MTNTRPKFVVRAALEDQYVDQLRRDFPQADFVMATTPQDVEREIGDAVALLGGGSLSPELLSAAPQLRWVAATSAGVEHLLSPELKAREDVVLTNFSGVAAPNIAEHVLALMLAFARGLPTLMRAQAAHRWAQEDDALPAPFSTFEIEGQTLFIVGLGEIGRALVPKAHALGLRIVATERAPHDQPVQVEHLWPQERMNDLLPHADHVVLCLPLTDDTRGIINDAALSTFKRGAYLYNVGRGGLIEQDALVAALRDGRLGGAGLDVTDPEPLPTDSPLWDAPNALITGHTAGETPQYWVRGFPLLRDNVRRFLAGEELQEQVSIGEGY